MSAEPLAAKLRALLYDLDPPTIPETPEESADLMLDTLSLIDVAGDDSTALEVMIGQRQADEYLFGLLTLIDMLRRRLPDADDVLDDLRGRYVELRSRS